MKVQGAQLWITPGYLESQLRSIGRHSRNHHQHYPGKRRKMKLWEATFGYSVIHTNPCLAMKLCGHRCHRIMSGTLLSAYSMGTNGTTFIGTSELNILCSESGDQSISQAGSCKLRSIDFIIEYKLNDHLKYKVIVVQCCDRMIEALLLRFLFLMTSSFKFYIQTVAVRSNENVLCGTQRYYLIESCTGPHSSSVLH
ncbi:hypothetical protein BDB01DRAFT_836095 [Pilobolus umbonatus]|nr:hypothetical protein BDB01DRAFT_840330 [Pilobolus umbonatus]KAI8982661.1 hypothetical protein BDB01DRAFT_836095 [Pilobolus umbonatus]